MQLRRIFTAVLALVALVAGLALTAPAAPAEAANNADFRADNIISDSVFFNSNTMSAGDIQNFLADKGRNCVAGSAPCIKDFRADSPSRPAQGAGHCGAYPGGTNELASTIIYKAAKACGINPQVLIVTLEKEQSLITGSRPSATRFAIAMGFDCPDTRACGSSSMGFEYQMYKAAWQFRQYTLTPNYFRYKPGNIAVQFNPNAACGSTIVNIKNQATANLYNYTPYQPNAAALRAGAGVGDSCSAYGNRNFFRFFTDWFGKTTTANNPVGGFSLQAEKGGFHVEGWALDPDDKTKSLRIDVYANGVGAGSFTANAWRPDIPVSYPGASNNLGMDASLDNEGGAQNICVYAINIGSGDNTLLGCKDLTIETASPHGGTSLDVQPGGVRLTGWTLDTDTKAALAVHVYIDGKGQQILANTSRPDVGRVFPGFGDNHGIDASFALSPGKHNLCAYGINVGRGSNKTLGCYDFTVENPNPFGGMDVTAMPGGAQLRGWTIDPNTTVPIQVHVYTDGKAQAVTTANANRTDVGRVYPKFGANHGIDTFLPMSAGTHQVCAYGINVNYGVNTLLGCSTVTVQSGSPFGGTDITPVAGGAQLRGWAIDPDTANPIQVHVYVDGAARAITANASRPDVGRAYPMYGSNHGIDTTLKLSRGTHQVCSYGINVGPGTNNLLACQTVNVTS